MIFNQKSSMHTIHRVETGGHSAYPGQMVAFSPGQADRWVKLKKFGLTQVPNVAVTDNIGDCSIREY